MIILLALLLAPSPAPQEPGSDPPTPEEARKQEESPAERARRERMERLRGTGRKEVAVGPDGKALVPGVLPAEASAEARAAWTAVREAVLAPEPVRAFDISFYLKQRQDSPQNNTAEARIQFLLPDNVRSVLTKSGRALLRGPGGDWLLDDKEKIKLVGREGSEDRRQLDEVVGIARNFIALTDPSSLRIAALSIEGGPPSGMPAILAERARELEWLAVVSPDFRLYSTPARQRGAPPPMFRALLGIDPRSDRVELALIHEAGGAQEMLGTTLLVHLLDLYESQGYLVPKEIHVYQIDPAGRPLRFRAKPSSELWLKGRGIDLRPSFVPADFKPK